MLTHATTHSSTHKAREDFNKVKIWNDDLIAVVTFDYGFYSKMIKYQIREKNLGCL